MNVSAGIFINDLVMQPNMDIIKRLGTYKLYYYKVIFNKEFREAIITSRLVGDINDSTFINELVNLYINRVRALPEDLLKHIPNKFYIFKEVETSYGFTVGVDILSEKYIDIDEVDRGSAIYKLKVWQH